MRNLAEKWPAPPAWETAILQDDGVAVKTLAGLNQWLVSGDLAAAARVFGISAEPVGAAGIAQGDPYAVRVARDRALVVSGKPLAIGAGWHGGGFAVTAMDAALHVFEIDGVGARDLLARATTLDPDGHSASASLLFAGVAATLYRHGETGPYRLHVDRGLAPYLWEWFGYATGARRETSAGRP